MCVNCNEIEIPQGDDGAQGPAGNDGVFGGFSGEWIFSSSTSSGPASQELRLDNPTYNSVTNIYVNDTNADSVNYDLFLDSLSNSSQYGYVRIFKEFDSSVFWVGRITGVTDNGADHTISVVYILHNGTFTANDRVVLTFSPAGLPPTTPPQRINTVFREQDTPYVQQTAAAYKELGTVVWDVNTFSYPETAKFVVQPTLVGQTYTLKIADNSGNTLFLGNFTATGTTKQVVDLGARLFSSSPAVRYLECAVRGDGTNAIYVYSMELYNQ